MGMRYVSSLSEEAMAFLGEDPAIYVNEAVNELLDADVKRRGFASVEEFVARMREIVRVGKLGGTREAEKAEAAT